MIFSISYDQNSKKATYSQDRELLINAITSWKKWFSPTDTYFLVDVPFSSAKALSHEIKKLCGKKVWERLFVIKVTSPCYDEDMTQKEYDWLTSKGINVEL